MKERKYRSNQGRSPKQENESLKIVSLSVTLFVVLTIVLILVQ